MNLFWLVILILLWGLFHTLFASVGIKSFVRKLVGPGLYRGYRLAYNLFAGASLVPILAAGAFLPDRQLYRVASPWLLLSLAGELIALAALGFGFLQGHPLEFLGLRQIIGLNPGPSKLSQDGLYHYVRHPLYTAGLAFIWLTPVMTLNLLVINLGLTVYILIGALFEERRLLAEYGQEYRVYMYATPMFIPFLKGNKSGSRSS